MTRFVPFVLQNHVLFIMFHTILTYNTSWHIGQEQNLASQIVHVVIAGNSVELPRALLNGQVMHLNAADIKAEYNCSLFAYKL